MTSAAEFLPEKLTLKALEEASRGCRGCDLYKNATQTVFGQGRPRARLMLVGEQPGDKEDLAGRLRRRPRRGRHGAFGGRSMSRAVATSQDASR